MPARPSRSYLWPVEGAYVEDSEEARALQRNMLPEYVPDHVSPETCSVCEEATGEVHAMALQSPHEVAFQAIGTPNNGFSNNAIGVSDGINQFWRGTFLENPPMAIEETILDMSPAMQRPYEAASDASSVTMNNSIDAEVATTNSTFERVWELMERRRRQRRECVVAGIAEEDWNLDRLEDVFPTRFTDEQWAQLLTEFSAEECQRLFVLEVAYWRAIGSEGQTASAP
ncbi:hypothetical protein E4U26_007758 [Claviceps purpurea]|nr:hypothetical protein E4U26_007758 [Claviceps purpurea]